ncbi:MAG: hypothetical protein V1792_22410 [Pseudomonadota bacterium]
MERECGIAYSVFFRLRLERWVLTLSLLMFSQGLVILTPNRKG